MKLAIAIVLVMASIGCDRKPPSPTVLFDLSKVDVIRPGDEFSVADANKYYNNQIVAGSFNVFESYSSEDKKIWIVACDYPRESSVATIVFNFPYDDGRKLINIKGKTNLSGVIDSISSNGTIITIHCYNSKLN